MLKIIRVARGVAPYALTAIVVGLIGLTTVAVATAANGAKEQEDAAAPTFGTIPDAAYNVDPRLQAQFPHGLDLSQVPDLVQALDREGNPAGYVKRDELFPVTDDGAALSPASTLTVYAEDGKAVVGTMVNGRGFVPEGTDPESVPEFEGQVVGPEAYPVATQP